MLGHTQGAGALGLKGRGQRGCCQEGPREERPEGTAAPRPHCERYKYMSCNSTEIHAGRGGGCWCSFFPLLQRRGDGSARQLSLSPVPITKLGDTATFTPQDYT